MKHLYFDLVYLNHEQAEPTYVLDFSLALSWVQEDIAMLAKAVCLCVY